MIARFSLCMLVAATLTPAAISQPCSAQAREKVTGIGGVFFRAHDPQVLAEWYERHLGIAPAPTSYETQPWLQLAGPTVFAPFASTTTYFGRPEQQWMMNFRVRDLDAMVQQLRAAGIVVDVDPTVHPNGRFARLHDPEGNPIELWEPKDQEAGSRSFDRHLALEDSAATSANVSVGDVNADGHQDILLVKGRHWPLDNLVLLGDGSGSFQTAYPVTAQPDRSYSGVLVDMDRDGDLDVVVSNDNPDAKLVHLNDGSGRFTIGSTYGRPEWSTRHVSVADLNGDSLPDVVLANRSDGSGVSYICFGVDGGRFDTECVGFARGSATTITPADFNNDGALDLAVPHRDGGQSFIYLNDGEGGFEERRPFGPPDAAIRSARAADLDGDRVLDLVVIDERSGPGILRGRSDGTYGAMEQLGDSRARPYAIAVADLDRNGRTDVIVGYVESRPVVYFNDGPEAFVAVSFGDDEGVAYGFAVGDLDEDGLLDIAMARSGAKNMVYFGASPNNGRR